MQLKNVKVSASQLVNNSESGGSCGNTYQTILMTPFRNWTLSLKFETQNDYVFVTSLNVTYSLDADLFDDFNSSLVGN